MISGLQTAFIKFHNNMVDLLRGDDRRIGPVARVHGGAPDHHVALPLADPQGVPAAVRRARRGWTPRCATAASTGRRVGAGVHAGRVPGRLLPLRPQHGAAVVPGQPGRRQRRGLLRDDLRPRRRGPARPGRPARQRSRAAALHRLADVLRLRRRRGPAEQADRHEHLDAAVQPAAAARSPSGDPPTSLPQRNLLRGITWSLPSGQAIARRIGAPPITVGELRSYNLDLDRSTPLFYYTLKEAEVVEGGLRLGPVGGTVVAEVFVGLLQSDPGSWVRTQPNWRPTLPPGGNFRMVDFLRFAKVDPASRGQ